ncbi:MAG: DUF2334 domain-containing protein [Eubacteriales bacterium]
MLKKILYFTCVIFVLILAAIFYRGATRSFSEFRQDNPDAGNAGNKMKALIRLEDVNPGTYNTGDKLAKLRAIADYLNEEGVTFHVSLIPYYKDPGKNVDISIGNTDDPLIREFIDTIKYMRDKGGLIGLHGYTHQGQSELTAAGYEFMEKGPAIYAKPAYAEERIEKALALAEKAGIPIDYWETPHYTASIEQYQLMSNYFGIMYEPNPRNRQLKNVSSWDSTGLSGQGVLFIPAPLSNVNGENDVGRILSQLDKSDPALPASFFFHPYQEFKFQYKVRAPEGYFFYAYETDSYLHRLISGFKERGYKFVSINDIACFAPAQRLDAFGGMPEKNKVLLAADFNGDRRDDLAAGDLLSGRFYAALSNVDGAIPRNNPASWGPAGEWLSGWAKGEGTQVVSGDFNGDGLSDLAAMDKEGKVWVATSDGNKFAARDLTWGKFPFAGKFFAGDFNGDGKCDLLCWSPTEDTWRVMLSRADSFTEPYIWLSGWANGEDVNVVVGDFNGDKKKDLAMVEKEHGAWRVALSNGSGFFPSEGTGDGAWFNNFAAGNAWQVAVGDFNGGGCDDVVVYNNTTGKWEFARSTGKNFLWGDWVALWGKDEKAHLLVADFNGDGRSDLAAERHFGEVTVIDTAISVINKKSNSEPAKP